MSKSKGGESAQNEAPETPENDAGDLEQQINDENAEQEEAAATGDSSLVDAGTTDETESRDEATDEEGSDDDGQKPAEDESADTTPTLKIVITMRGDRSVVAVQRRDTDAEWSVLEGELEEALEQVPAILEQADAKWAENPKRRDHVPASAAKKAGSGTKKTTGKAKRNSKPKDRNAVPSEEHSAPEPPAAEVAKQTEAAATPRLF